MSPLRRIVALCFLLSGLVGAVVAGWSIATHPVGQWLVPLADAEMQAQLRRAVAAEVSDDWVAAELENALDGEPVDWVDIGILEEIAETHDLVIPSALAARIEAERPGFAAGAMSCARCAVQPSACDLGELFYCRMPIELTPVADVSILVAAGADAAQGYEVDGFNVALAGIGLGATVLALPSGGSSMAVKGGAATMRLARNAGLLSARLVDEMRTLAAGLVRWDRAPTGVDRFSRSAWRQAMDPAAFGQAQRLGGDLSTVAGSMRPAHAAVMLKGADSLSDISGLARIARVQGDRAVHTVRVLGKSRALRTGMRVSRAAINFFGGLAALVIGLLGLLASVAQTLLARRVGR